MEVDLEVPDHTTLSRRSQHLDVKLRRFPTNEPIDLIVDSTGLSIVGEGEWAAAKHGGKGKRGWKKLHLGVDPTGIIVAQVLTNGHADDAATVPDLLAQVWGLLECAGRLGGRADVAAWRWSPVTTCLLTLRHRHLKG